MNHRAAAALVVAALLAVPAVALGAVTGSPSLDATLQDDTLVPGEQTTLDVVLLNEGDVDSGSSKDPQLDSQVTTARGLTVKLRSGSAPITVETPQKGVGTLPTGTSGPLPFSVSVDEDAEPGTYTVPVTVDYSYTSYISEGSGARDTNTTERTFSLRVKVEDQARFAVRDVESTTRVGATGTVDVTVENVGTEVANDTTLTLESTSGDVSFGGAPTATRYAGAWEEGERRTFEFRARTAGTGDSQQYALRLSAAFEDAEGRDRNSETLSFEIRPDPEQTFTVVGAEGTVPIDGEGAYELTLRNEGPVAVSDATVRLRSQSADLTFGGSNAATMYVGSWAPGETRTVVYDAQASESAERRDYALTASVSYEDGEGDPGADEGLSVGLRPAPEQAFGVSDVESTLRVGDEGQLTGRLVNEGDTAVENVVLEWASESQNVSPTETEYAVGRIGAGEAANFSFGVEISEGADPGPRQFALVAEYRDRQGDLRESDQLDVRETVSAARDVFDVRAVNTTVTAGDGRTIELEVTNAGDQTLTDISAKLFAESPISTTDSEAFVGSLEPGETRTLAFGISAGGSALAKDYPVSLDFQYEEPDGDTPTSDTYRLPVSVADDSGSGGGFPIVLVGAAALAVGLGVVGFRYLR